MDEHEYNQTVERLNKVNEVIEGLDASIRADAFKLLKPYVAAGAAADEEDEVDLNVEESGEKRQKSGGGSVDFDELIESHESDKDYENAVLALAIIYARYGRGPFPLTMIKDTANEFNLTVPARPDKFFARHKRNGKEVLRKQAEGWKVTPSGEQWLKETYEVSRGKQSLPSADES